MSGTDPEAAARAFYASTRSPQDTPATPPASAPAAAPDPFAGLRTPEPAPAAPAAPPANVPKPEPMDLDDRAEAIYGHAVPTRGQVDWSEPAAEPAEYRLEAPPGMLDTSDEGKAAMDRLRSGFAEAGAGQTIARELFADAVRFQQGGAARTSKDTAEAQLRQQYGSKFDARMGEARALIQRVAQRCPEIITFLETTGLGNDPSFVRKVVAAGRRNRRSG